MQQSKKDMVKHVHDQLHNMMKDTGKGPQVIGVW